MERTTEWEEERTQLGRVGKIKIQAGSESREVERDKKMCKWLWEAVSGRRNRFRCKEWL